MKKFLRLFVIIIFTMTLYSCDPVYQGYLSNTTNSDIEVMVCGEDLSQFNDEKAKDTTFLMGALPVNCKKAIVKTGESIHLASASGVAQPLTYEDLGFDKIVIRMSNGQIAAEGTGIMQLFTIRKIKNGLGIHTGNEYYIEIGEK